MLSVLMKNNATSLLKALQEESRGLIPMGRIMTQRPHPRAITDGWVEEELRSISVPRRLKQSQNAICRFPGLIQVWGISPRLTVAQSGFEE
jgi:hypothetical protein